MTIEPWRATCIQTKSRLAVKAPDRAGAWAIINDNIAHVIGLIEAATGGAASPDLVVSGIRAARTPARPAGGGMDRKSLLLSSRRDH